MVSWQYIFWQFVVPTISFRPLYVVLGIRGANFCGANMRTDAEREQGNERRQKHDHFPRRYCGVPENPQSFPSVHCFWQGRAPFKPNPKKFRGRAQPGCRSPVRPQHPAARFSDILPNYSKKGQAKQSRDLYMVVNRRVSCTIGRKHHGDQSC
jgi:hypothetical protein